jgi:hypothetical protein
VLEYLYTISLHLPQYNFLLNLVKTADWVYDILDNKLRYPVIYEIDKEFTRTSAEELLNWAMKVYNDQLNLRESYTEVVMPEDKALLAFTNSCDRTPANATNIIFFILL